MLWLASVLLLPGQGSEISCLPAAFGSGLDSATESSSLRIAAAVLLHSLRDSGVHRDAVSTASPALLYCSASSGAHALPFHGKPVHCRRPSGSGRQIRRQCLPHPAQQPKDAHATSLRRTWPAPPPANPYRARRPAQPQTRRVQQQQRCALADLSCACCMPHATCTDSDSVRSAGLTRSVQQPRTCLLASSRSRCTTAAHPARRCAAADWCKHLCKPAHAALQGPRRKKRAAAAPDQEQVPPSPSAAAKSRPRKQPELYEAGPASGRLPQSQEAGSVPEATAAKVCFADCGPHCSKAGMQLQWRATARSAAKYSAAPSERHILTLPGQPLEDWCSVGLPDCCST